MNELREKLHQAIDEYGISDERTIAISQELDKLIYKKQRTYQRNGTSKYSKLIITERIKKANGRSKMDKNSY